MKLEMFRDGEGKISSTRVMRFIYGIAGMGIAFYSVYLKSVTYEVVILILGLCGITEAVNAINKKTER